MSYKSFHLSLDAWVSKRGPKVKDKTTIGDFLDALVAAGYNTEKITPLWKDRVWSVYNGNTNRVTRCGK